MNVLIGDIGNTTTKICLIEIKTFKVKKIISFSSNNISSKNFLKKNFKKNSQKKIFKSSCLIFMRCTKISIHIKKISEKNLQY